MKHESSIDDGRYLIQSHVGIWGIHELDKAGGSLIVCVAALSDGCSNFVHLCVYSSVRTRIQGWPGQDGGEFRLVASRGSASHHDGARRWDASDRRVKTLHLSAEDRKRADQLEKALLSFRQSLFQDIERSDVDACVRVPEVLPATIAEYRGAKTFLAADSVARGRWWLRDSW